MQINNFYNEYPLFYNEISNFPKKIFVERSSCNYNMI